VCEFNPWEAWRAEKARADRAEAALRLQTEERHRGYVGEKARADRAEADAGTWKNRWNDAVTNAARLNQQLRLCNADQLDAESRIAAALEWADRATDGSAWFDELRQILRGE
jgi:hypothetical protein